MLVLKIGGSMADKAGALAADIASIKEQFVIVHGGGPQTTALEKATGREPRYIYSKEGFKSRYTDAGTMQNFVLAVGGVNTMLVQQLRKSGVNAVGVSGSSGIIHAKRKTLISYENGKEKMIRDDYSGKIGRIDIASLRALLSAGFVPVVAPIALGEEFEALNVDGDRAAAAIAGTLKAEKLVLFTDVEGYFRNFPRASPSVSPTAPQLSIPKDPHTSAEVAETVGAGPLDLVSSAKSTDISGFQAGANAGMKRKLVAAGEALAAGVPEVIMCSGLIEKPVTSALNGGGTHFSR